MFTSKNRRNNPHSSPPSSVARHAQPQDTSQLAYDQLFRGPQAAARMQAVRNRLNSALEAWWQNGQMPSRGLLRDGLLGLEANHALDDPQRTLLLRASLYYGRGMRTALRHQTDPERTASVMRDLLLHIAHPLSPAQIRQLASEDEMDQGWFRALLRLLREEAATALEPRRTLAAAALAYLENTPANHIDGWTAPGSAQESLSEARPASRLKRRSSRRQLRALANVLGMLAVLLLVVAAILFWQDIRQTNALIEDMRTIPDGSYVIGVPSSRDEERLMELNAFAIDRTEVTNRAYRRCYDAGACSWPARVTSISRPDYYLDPSRGDYPMINVTWEQADAFCAWVGKRLPLAQEWEVAAGSALTLQARFLFPWGNLYDPQLANSVLSPAQDTLPVGTFSPAGNSPSGAVDMAGNVAEWTSTPADAGQEGRAAYIIKGGSFLDDPEELLLSNEEQMDADAYAPWLGFRCALTLPDDQ